jgi:hypothetical protein
MGASPHTLMLSPIPSICLKNYLMMAHVSRTCFRQSIRGPCEVTSPLSCTSDMELPVRVLEGPCRQRPLFHGHSQQLADASGLCLCWFVVSTTPGISNGGDVFRRNVGPFRVARRYKPQHCSIDRRRDMQSGGRGGPAPIICADVQSSRVCVYELGPSAPPSVQALLITSEGFTELRAINRDGSVGRVAGDRHKGCRQ